MERQKVIKKRMGRNERVQVKSRLTKTCNAQIHIGRFMAGLEFAGCVPYSPLENYLGVHATIELYLLPDSNSEYGVLYPNFDAQIHPRGWYDSRKFNQLPDPDVGPRNTRPPIEVVPASAAVSSKAERVVVGKKVKRVQVIRKKRRKHG